MIALNFEAANALADERTDLGVGIFPINFVDDAKLRGNYSLFVRIERRSPPPSKPGDGPQL